MASKTQKVESPKAPRIKTTKASMDHLPSPADNGIWGASGAANAFLWICSCENVSATSSFYCFSVQNCCELLCMNIYFETVLEAGKTSRPTGKIILLPSSWPCLRGVGAYVILNIMFPHDIFRYIHSTWLSDSDRLQHSLLWLTDFYSLID